VSEDYMKICIKVGRRELTVFYHITPVQEIKGSRIRCDACGSTGEILYGDHVRVVEIHENTVEVSLDSFVGRRVRSLIEFKTHLHGEERCLEVFEEKLKAIEDLEGQEFPSRG